MSKAERLLGQYMPTISANWFAVLLLRATWVEILPDGSIDTPASPDLEWFGDRTPADASEEIKACLGLPSWDQNEGIQVLVSESDTGTKALLVAYLPDSLEDDGRSAFLQWCEDAARRWRSLTETE